MGGTAKVGEKRERVDLDDDDRIRGVAFRVVRTLANLCDTARNRKSVFRFVNTRTGRELLTSQSGTSFMISFSRANAACSLR